MKNVFMMTATGTKKTKVTTSGQVSMAAVWSPNGQTLAFVQPGGIHLVKATPPFGTPYPLLTFLDYEGPEWAGSTYPYLQALAWSPNGEELAYVGSSGDSPDYAMRFVSGMTTVTSGALHEEEMGLWTGGDSCGYEDWSDFNYVPNGVFGYSVVDHGSEYEFEHINLIYPGFVSQQGDKAGVPSSSGAHMVFVRTTGTTPNIWTSTIKGAQRKQVQVNGYQPDWQPLP